MNIRSAISVDMGCNCCYTWSCVGRLSQGVTLTRPPRDGVDFPSHFFTPASRGPNLSGLGPDASGCFPFWSPLWHAACYLSMRELAFLNAFYPMGWKSVFYFCT